MKLSTLVLIIFFFRLLHLSYEPHNCFQTIIRVNFGIIFICTARAVSNVNKKLHRVSIFCSAYAACVVFFFIERKTSPSPVIWTCCWTMSLTCSVPLREKSLCSLLNNNSTTWCLFCNKVWIWSSKDFFVFRLSNEVVPFCRWRVRNNFLLLLIISFRQNFWYNCFYILVIETVLFSTNVS